MYISSAYCRCWLEDRTQGQSSYDLIYILPSLFVLLVSLQILFILFLLRLQP